ncbi:MAG: DNA ligase [Thiohalocapsa sp.]
MTRLYGRRFGLSLLLLGALRGHAAAPIDSPDCDADAAEGNSDCEGQISPWRVAQPSLQLATVYEPGDAVAEFLVSEKLDGVRAYWDGWRLITRGGLVINAPHRFTAGFPNTPLDGELWMGRGTFTVLSGTVRRIEPELDAWRRVRYLVFDLPDPAEESMGHPEFVNETNRDPGFERRLLELNRLVAASSNPHLGLVEQTSLDNHDELMALLDKIVAAGGEGLMLHRRDARYRAGRSSVLLKVKPYLEADARVIAHLPGRGKYQNMLGSLLVEEPDGTRFRVGTGFSDAERVAPPPPGSLITFKYHGRTKYGRPRFASFLRVADDL